MPRWYGRQRCWRADWVLDIDVKGYFDSIEVKDVLRFESGLHGFMKSSHAALLQKIEDTKKLEKDDEAALADAIADFKKSF